MWTKDFNVCCVDQIIIQTSTVLFTEPYSSSSGCLAIAFWKFIINQSPIKLKIDFYISTWHIQLPIFFIFDLFVWLKPSTERLFAVTLSEMLQIVSFSWAKYLLPLLSFNFFYSYQVISRTRESLKCISFLDILRPFRAVPIFHNNNQSSRYCSAEAVNE